jgi:hypothetical protein
MGLHGLLQRSHVLWHEFIISQLRFGFSVFFNLKFFAPSFPQSISLSHSHPILLKNLAIPFWLDIFLSQTLSMDKNPFLPMCEVFARIMLLAMFQRRLDITCEEKAP